jgi:hypothetical protein
MVDTCIVGVPVQDLLKLIFKEVRNDKLSSKKESGKKTQTNHKWQHS